LKLTSLGWNAHFQAIWDAKADPNLIPARVSAEHRDRFQILTATGESPAVTAGKLRHQADGGDWPAVGDWVAVRMAAPGDLAVIEAVLPRVSRFVRKAAGTDVQVQVVAANLTTVFLVAALDRDFNLRRLERYLVLAAEGGVTAVIVLSKADQCPDPGPALQAVGGIAPGAAIVPVSATTGEGVAQLAPWLGEGETVALLGSSGVGKSTLANRLLGREVQSTQAVREQDQRGRHTTTHRELFRLPTGGLLVDTPGMRELQLWHAEEGLAGTFDDLVWIARDCQFRDCSHAAEPGCAVQAGIAAGWIDASRVASWQKLAKELAWLARKQDPLAMRAEKAKWKQIHKQFRQRLEDGG
jgi:ribosome biogenesis GTPase / thiamine phosphate phosphatase